MVAVPVPMLDTYNVYAVASATALPEMFSTTRSLELMKVLFNVNDTATPAANAAPFIVMRPADLFSVTAVDLLVNCVTVPWAAVV